MLRSMTGYGRGEASLDGADYTVEIRSVNHRFCDVSVQMPRWLKPLEHEIRRMVQDRFERGRFDVTVSAGGHPEQSPSRFSFDDSLAESYVRLLKSVKKRLGLSGRIDLNQVLQLRDILKLEEEERNPKDVLPGVSAALSAALDSLKAMREAEGKTLCEDILERLGAIEGYAGEIEKRRPEIVEEYRRRLHDRITQLLEGINADPQRIEQEVVIFAEKSDIHEEIVRLGSHLNEFQKLVEGEEAVGRKLEFLLQEIGREINTVASKSPDVAASQTSVNIKAELEKIRQQIQNVE